MLKHIVALVLLTQATSFAQSLEEVEKRICDAWSKVSAVTYDLSVKSSGTVDGNPLKVEGIAKVEMTRSGGIWMIRSEMNSKSWIQINGEEKMIDQSWFYLLDGTYTFRIENNGVEKLATKEKIGQRHEKFGAEMFKELHKLYELTLMPEETVEGEKCFVIKCKSKTGGAFEIEHFSVSSGLRMIRTSIVKNERRDQTTTETVLNVKINPSVDKKRFELPDGVKVDEILNVENNN